MSTLGGFPLLGFHNETGGFVGDYRDRILTQSNGNPYDLLSKVRNVYGPDVLFIIERNLNRNIVVYQIRRNDDGTVC